jgi:hypothetical protein
MTDQPWWHTASEPSGDQLGSAAEEAARLFGAMRDRILADPNTMRAGAKMLHAFAAVRGAANPVPPGDAPECAYCPFCQALLRARSLSPETVERLAGAAMEFAETVRQVVVNPADTDDDRVRHVPLDEDFGDWPEPRDVGADPAAEEESAPPDR